MERIILDAHRDLEKINALLHVYAGSSIQLWSFHVSFSQLHLRIDRGAAGNFHLEMAGVRSLICPKLFWELHGNITYEDSPSLYEPPRYIFIDERSSIRVICGTVRLEENVEPLFLS